MLFKCNFSAFSLASQDMRIYWLIKLKIQHGLLAWLDPDALVMLPAFSSLCWTLCFPKRWPKGQLGPCIFFSRLAIASQRVTSFPTVLTKAPRDDLGWIIMINSSDWNADWVWPYTHLEDSFTYLSYREKHEIACSSISRATI